MGKVMSLSSISSILLDVLGEIVAPNACAACDEPAPPRILFCEACAATVASADAAGAVFAYGGAIADAIVRLKFRGRPDLGARLGNVMFERWSGSADIVVPVPLHPRRLAERGYNQSALLASPIAKRLGVPHAPRAVERVRDTPHQMDLARAARARNVAGAFVCKIHSIVAARRVLLVDDVTTTGATLEACASVLRRAGASAVVTLALSRRERD
jgi:ComF family protein